MNTDKPVGVALCGVVMRDGAILLTSRPPGKINAGLWEFPGGKLDAGEDPRAGLAREFTEELGVNVRVGSVIDVSTAEHPRFSIVLLAFWCTIESGEPIGLEGQEVRWAAAASIDPAELTPADRPILATIRQQLLQPVAPPSV